MSKTIIELQTRVMIQSVLKIAVLILFATSCLVSHFLLKMCRRFGINYIEKIISFQAWDYRFERIENMNDTDSAHVLFDLHVKRLGRSDFVIIGNITFRSVFTKNPDKYYVKQSTELEWHIAQS